MKYFVTGITGTVVPVIIEKLITKAQDPFFYFAIRKGAKGEDIESRFHALVKTLDLDPNIRHRLISRSRLVEIDATREQMGIDDSTYQELIENTEKILHGAADVRFDQPYEKIRISNVVFTQKMYDLFAKIRRFRRESSMSAPTFYYISTGYAYGRYTTHIPEDYPAFHPSKPDNTYAQTKAEAKFFILDKIKQHDDPIVIFEPTIIGGDSETGRTRTYNLHYVVLMLGYLGKLPLLTAPDNQLDIVPVNWVADIISDVMAKDEFHQGLLRMASGPDAVTIRYLYDAGYKYYTENNPVEGHVIPPIRFVPRWCFLAMVHLQKTYYRAMYLLTRKQRYKKLVKGISLLEGYFPYITERKVFDNEKSTRLIERYTDCSKAPTLQDVWNEAGERVQEGYYPKIMADTLATGWGGLVDFKRLEKKSSASKKARSALNTSQHES